MATRRRAFHEVWWRICLVALVGMTATRVLRYALIDPPRWLDDLIGHALVLQFFGLAASVPTLPVQVAVVGVVAIGLIVRPRWCVRSEGRVWELRPWLASLIWPLLALDSLVVDAHPEPLALYAVTLLALGVLTTSRERTPTGEIVGLACLGLGAAAFSLAQSRSALEGWRVVICVLVAVPLVLWARSRLRTRDALAVVMALALLDQGELFFAGYVRDAAANDPRRKVLGPGDAYSFCEMRDAGRVFAVLPTCIGSTVEGCRHDAIAEYDAHDLSPVHRFEPFNDNLYGRMLHLVCLDDSLLVGMAHTKLFGRLRPENVMEVSARDGTVLQADVVGPKAGHRMLRHPDGSAVFVVSEYSNVIRRQPLALTGDPRRAPATPIDLGVSGGQAWLSPFRGSLQTEVDAVLPSRKSGFFAEWIGGHRVHEVELDTGRLLRSYPVNGGGTHSMAVDRELNRLLVTGLWGIDAIDLTTGRVVARRRTELGPRLPIVDTRRDRIYVATTFGNYVWILDRRTLAVVGKLPVGPGGRNLLLTSDGRHLLVGGRRQHVAWDLDQPL